MNNSKQIAEFISDIVSIKSLEAAVIFLQKYNDTLESLCKELAATNKYNNLVCSLDITITHFYAEYSQSNG